MKILNLNILIILVFIIISCSSIDTNNNLNLKKELENIENQLVQLNKNLDLKSKEFFSKNDIEISISDKVINNILYNLSNYNNKDIVIKLLPTKHIYRKEVNVLGIQYTNYVNIDSGFINIDIKSIKKISQQNNEVTLQVELSGNGSISLSGKNTGISASITSKIDAYTKDTISFKLQSQSNNIILKPQNNNIGIKTKFTISLFGWDIPWRETINLNLSDLLKPFEIPLSISSSLELLLPDFKNNKMTFKEIPTKIETNNFSVSTSTSGIKIQSNINFIKK